MQTVNLERIRASLSKLGTPSLDQERIISSPNLERLIIPMWTRVNAASDKTWPWDVWVIKLPDLLEEFSKKFPDAVLRWQDMPQFGDDYESGVLPTKAIYYSGASLTSSPLPPGFEDFRYKGEDQPISVSQELYSR